MYSAEFEITRADGDFKVNYNIKVVSKEKVLINEKINDEDNSISEPFIESGSDDKLVIKSKTDNTVEYIISKSGNQYYLMGNTIYMLNPPNDKHVLNKEKIN